MKVSVVSPVYFAQGIINELVQRLESALKKVGGDYEIILVDDGSLDKSWTEISKICSENKKVKGIKLSRNFGQHYAITAGLSESTGDYVAVIDCDLQDNPDYLPEMVQLAQKNHDIVLTTRHHRSYGFFKNFTASLFTLIFNFLSPDNSTSTVVGNFSLLSRRAVQAFLRFKDVHRHYLMIVRRIGFDVTYLNVEHSPRFKGRSTYNFMKLVNHAVDGVISQSHRVLYFTVFAGLMFFAFSFIGICYYLYNYFVGSTLPGYTSLIVMLLFTSGITLIFLGILGLYIGKIFDQVRERPLYIIQDILNSNKQDLR